MKLLKLTIFNMASLEGVHIIDFESEPLKSADLFSIVGETGSGKSTILDAVCLALYGVAPRFYNATKVSVYSDEPVNKNQVLSTDDPRNILRKGTKECYSEVEFLARDGYRYRAYWGCSIARTNYSRPLRRLFRLENLPEGGSREKELEIATEGGKAQGRRNVNNGALDNIIGLDYSQFTRTVMLAQNSFANFIKAEDREKAVLLEKLTGTEFYTAVARKIYELYKEAESCYLELYNDVKSVEALVLPDDKLAMVCETMEGLKKALTQLDTDIQKNKDWQKWYSDRNNLEKEVADASSLLAKAVDVSRTLDSVRNDIYVLDVVSEVSKEYHSDIALKKEISHLESDFSESVKKLELKDREAVQITQAVEKFRSEFQSARESLTANEPLILKAREELVNLKNIRGVADSLQKEESALALRCKELQKEISQNETSVSEKDRIIVESEKTIESMLPHLGMIESVGVIKENLLSLDAAYKQKLSEVKEIESDELRIRSIKASSAKLIDDVEKTTQDEGSLKQILSEKQAEISGIDISMVNSRLDSLREKHRALTELQKLYSGINSHRHAISELEASVAVLTKDRDALMGEYDKLDAELKQTDTVLRSLEEVYNITASKGVAELRAGLKKDCPCPVCGSTEHPYLHDAGTVETVLKPFRVQIEEKRKFKTELEQRINHPENGLMARINVAGGRIASQGETLAATRKLLVDEVAEWNKISEAFPMWHDYSVNGLEKEILDAVEQNVKEGQELKRQSERYNNLNNEIQVLQKKYNKTFEQLRLLTQNLHSLESEEKQYAGSLAQKRVSLEKTLEGIASLEDGIGMRISLSDWKTTYSDKGSKEIIECMEDMATRYSVSVKTRDEAVQTKSQLAVALEKLRRQLEENFSLLSEKQKDVSAQRTLLEERMRLYSSYLNSEDPDKVEQRLKSAVSCSEDSLKSNESQLKTVNEDLNIIKGTVNTISETLKYKKVCKEELDKRLDAFIASLPEKLSSVGAVSVDRQKLDYYLGDSVNWLEKRNMLKQADDEIKRLQGNLEAKEEALKKHVADGLEAAGGELPGMDSLITEADAMNQRHVQLEEEKQQTGSILLTHNQSVERLGSCREELDKRRKKYTDWKELNDILGNANADRFRETAQCMTLHFLVRQANEQLRLLNRRYSLDQIPNSLGVRVIDHDRADEVRNISSLSGGETFLVSLALALGLSSLSSRNINMANLFVDEGFGTLDSNSLNMVIDALSGLQSMQGKKVGVISHTMEMKERIRTQIRVVKSGSSGRSSIEIH